MSESADIVLPTEEQLLFFVPPSPGEVITSTLTNNTYTMGDRIGEGNFGIVYECTDTWGNELAAKVIKMQAHPYEKIRAAAVAEFYKLVALRHPNVTYIYDAFEFRNTCYIIVERCHETLAEHIRHDGIVGFYWVKPIARCLLQAVHFLHINGFAHQDIHLGNIFTNFVKDEMPSKALAINFKLADLGVAKLFDEIDATNTRANWILPPEVIRPLEFGPIDSRIDIYHCGLVLLRLALSREIRFTEEETLAGRPRLLAEALPSPMNFAISKALRRHVPQRTATAMELWRDLNLQSN